jgi:hypothetical protein
LNEELISIYFQPSKIPTAAATHHHASSTTGTKRLRDVEGDSSTSNDESNDKIAPQKRQRQDGVFQVSN